MQTLRRWTPPAAAAAVAEAPPPPSTRRQQGVRRDLVAPKDMAFCAEFAAHGGLARSPDGFKGEAELVRMHRAGLLELERDPAPPYGVISVSLSPAARTMLTGEAQGRAEPDGRASTPALLEAQRRKGFEVARAMVGTAVKVEIAAWAAQGAPGGPAGLEQRLMGRINDLPAPFQP